MLVLAAILALAGCSGGEEKAQDKAENKESAVQSRAAAPARPGLLKNWRWLVKLPPPDGLGPRSVKRSLAPRLPECSAPEIPDELEDTPAVKPAPAAKALEPERKTAAKTPRPPRLGAVSKTSADVEREFQIFAKRFLDKMARNLRFTAMNKEVVKTDGGYLARFIDLEKDSMTVDVKPCEGAASYVGVMRYLEGHYQNLCATADCAKDGPFELVKKVRTTEIFRYAGGRWHE